MSVRRKNLRKQRNAKNGRHGEVPFMSAIDLSCELAIHVLPLD